MSWPSTAAFAATSAAVDAAVEAGHTPGAVLLAGRGDETVHEHVVGLAESAAVSGAAHDRALTPQTWFDLASLTKVMGTLPCVLLLCADGRIALADKVQQHLPAFSGAGKDAVTVRHLLAHSSGLAAHRDFVPASRDVMVDAVLAEPLEAAPGTRVVYSDLGFITLGAVVETVTGVPLDEVWRDRVAAPIGLRHSGFRPPADVSVAATEPPPGGPDQLGDVHDENARAMSGIAGHAGLFGTAADVAMYLRRAWLSTDLLPAALIDDALRCQTDGLDGRRGLGWTLRGDRWDHMGQQWPQTGAGHTGFTGTCVALDRPSGCWVVLLTNAVHHGRDRTGVIPLRRHIHDLLMQAS
jgi:CubicO group peptidase (beta-lactamase class C family)